MKQSSKEKIDEKLEYLDNYLKNKVKCAENENTLQKDILKAFKFQFKQKWIAASYKEDRFLRKNEQWLNASILISKMTI